jgi:transposase InsO family protein
MRQKNSAGRSSNNEQSPDFMYLTIDQLSLLGISKTTAVRKLNTGEWKSHDAEEGSGNKRNRKILVSSLPVEVQINWAKQLFISESSEQSASTAQEVSDGVADTVKDLSAALLRLPRAEQINWIKEALRLAQVIQRYAGIKQKRQRSRETGKTEFVPEVLDLCLEAICKDQVILAREPHRAYVPSPYTLDGWCRSYKALGLLTFIRSCKSRSSRVGKTDNRLVALQPAAVEWINSNWNKSTGPRHFFNAFQEKAKLKHWNIPSESWFFRLWEHVPEVVKVLKLKGHNAYESKLAPYVPRDYSDLQALQVLAGDHSERDITVSLPDGTIGRPWLTIWYDLLTALIWGWHLSLVPSSYTAGLAYADGVKNFGAQPFSRPEDGFYSYIYTDRGRDYRSHRWDGQIITVHKEAMCPEGGFKALLVQQRVGIVEELSLKHLTTRGHNPRENPVERIHGIISEWERNTFKAYCGRNPASRPEQWHKLLLQQKRFEKGKRDSSPFPSLDEYREKLAEFITCFNTSPHVRTTLGGIKVVPLEAFNRLYTTHYKIDPKALAILLMKPATQKIKRNGVQLFQKNWFYLHESMLEYIGAEIEIRYSDGDYNSVFVILPNGQVCEAERITPSSIIHPNAHTQKVIAKARTHEKRIAEEFHFIAQSKLRGETTEDRVAKELNTIDPFEEEEEEKVQTASVHMFTRASRRNLRQVSGKEVTVADVRNAEAEPPLFIAPISDHISEFDSDD